MASYEQTKMQLQVKKNAFLIFAVADDLMCIYFSV